MFNQKKKKFKMYNKIFRQVIGPPMAHDPTPLFSNLFLSYYENKRIGKVKENDIRQARRVENVFSFIDGLTALNDVGKFR